MVIFENLIKKIRALQLILPKFVEAGVVIENRAVIDACQHFEWKKELYSVARDSSELRGQLKWEGLSKELC